MAYKRKTWVNVPNPDSYTGDIPLSDLPRFDADNMNRIEDGVEKAISDFTEHKSDKTNPHEVTPGQIGAAIASHSHTANSLLVKSLGGGTEIKENDDLNAYTDVGNYFCMLTLSAKSLSNCPVTSAFSMTVSLGNGSITHLHQEVIEIITGKRYFRTYNASTEVWTDWQSIYSTNNKPTVKDVSGAAQIVTGYYVGTGTYGQANPNKLTFSFVPKVIFVFCEWVDAYMFPTQPYGRTTLNATGSSSAHNLSVIPNGTTISWYEETGVIFQLNESNKTYRYVAIG